MMNERSVQICRPPGTKAGTKLSENEQISDDRNPLQQAKSDLS
jgi:hypothetical protein